MSEDAFILDGEVFCGADRDYKRVIEAEIYLEALHEMRKIDRWEDPTV